MLLVPSPCLILKMHNCENFIFSSSATVYGIKYLPYDESHPTVPFNNYGRTKLIADTTDKSMGKNK